MKRMRGYGILITAVSLFLLMSPVVLLDKPVPPTADVVTDEPLASVKVKQTDSDEIHSVDLRELTLFETAASIGADAPIEAIKAHVVAAYTCFRYQCESNRGQSADILSTALSYPQCYTETYWKEQWGESYKETLAVYQRALEAVYGKCLLYEGKPIMALTHHLNTGQTEDGEALFEKDIPYLQSVASPADALATDLLTTVTVPLTQSEEILKTLLGEAEDDKPLSDIQIADRTQAGTVKTVKIGDKTCTGYELQSAFSLPSPAFEVDVQQEMCIFTVRGNGHFVGLSSCGATAMARDGHTYEEILKHYFTGATI